VVETGQRMRDTGGEGFRGTVPDMGEGGRGASDENGGGGEKTLHRFSPFSESDHEQ
jgi:hypothetical protein